MLRWWLNTLTHPWFWRDWYRDWRGIRRHTSRKALARRVVAMEQRNRAVFDAIAAIVGESGCRAAEEALRAGERQPERHLHVVRLAA